MAVNKINYCLCHEATTLSTMPTGFTTCNSMKMYLNLMSLSLPNLLDLKFTKLMSCLSSELTLLDYIGDILSVM